MVHDLRERLRHLNPDIVFQEVQGLHLRHAESHHNWPNEPQHEFLAADVWGLRPMATIWFMTTATTVMPFCRVFRLLIPTIRMSPTCALRNGSPSLPDRTSRRRTGALRLRSSLVVWLFAAAAMEALADYIDQLSGTQRAFDYCG